MGVNVGVMVAVDAGAKVAADVAVRVGASVKRPVGVGIGGRELPQILGREPQPDNVKASNKTIMRFRVISPSVKTYWDALWIYFNMGIFNP